MSEFNKERSIFVNEEFTIEGAGGFVLKIFNMELESEEPIFIIINSKGGNIRALKTMMSAINGSKCKVVTVVIGCATSCAAILFLQGAERIILEGAEILFHEPSRDMDGEYRYSELLEKIKTLEKTYNLFVDQMVLGTYFKKEDVIKKIKGKNYTLNAKEAVEIGAATRSAKSLMEV
jgi:ATP-dependent protease ClpP protease subunit